MQMLLGKYERKPGTMEPDYNKDHTVTIEGETAAELMAQVSRLRTENDLTKYTPIEIWWVYD